jgi:nitroreductase
MNSRPATNKPNEMILIEQLQWRYAVQKFDETKKLTAQDWQALEQALVLTPSSYGLQPWKFLIVQNPELRKQLCAASWNQTQVLECSQFVVFCVLNKIDEAWIDRYIRVMAETRGLEIGSLERFRAGMSRDLITGARSALAREWAARQVYIALGNFMTSAAVLNIDTCPMEGIDTAKYDAILDLKNSGFSTLCACAVGYRAADDEFNGVKKVRFPTKDVIEYL